MGVREARRGLEKKPESVFRRQGAAFFQNLSQAPAGDQTGGDPGRSHLDPRVIDR
jgi:hypothetical protein